MSCLNRDRRGFGGTDYGCSGDRGLGDDRGGGGDRRRRRSHDLAGRRCHRIAGAMQHARALDLDYHLLGAAVREALLDLADLDRLVEAEGGTHAEFGFVIVAHQVAPNAFRRR